MSWSAANRAAGRVFSVFFPADCRLCNAPLLEISRVPVCARCLDSVPPGQAEYFCSCCRTPFLNDRPLNPQRLCPLCSTGANRFDLCDSYGSYDGVLRELIHLFKYERVTPLASRFGALLSRAAPRDGAFDAVVPMPLHWWRRWRRGFNQAELLGREVALRLGIPMVRVVKRRKPTAPQTGLTSAARRRNVAGAFRVAARREIAGKRLLLVDDVLTTGATVNACAAALKAAGASYVAVLTLARADRRGRVELYRPESAGESDLGIVPNVSAAPSGVFSGA